MPLHKIRPLARKSCSGSSGSMPQSPAPYSSSNTDKSNQAAHMAQQLASESSWADRYVPGTPATIMTPPESIADNQSQTGAGELPPSYEDVRREREFPPPPPPLLPSQNSHENEFWRSDGFIIPPPPQRNYIRHETSSAITGTFSFYEGLDLSTTSGSINITIDPQPSDKVGTIHLKSSSGSVKVRFSDEYMKGIAMSGMLSRVCDIEITTKSGSQALDLPIGNGDKISMTSETGSINAKFLLAQRGSSTNITTLSTESTHGSQSIKFKASSPELFTSLAGNLHVKGSASIKLGLPFSWEGMVHASSGGSGSVDVKGEGLQYQRYGNKEIYAWRVHDNDQSKAKREGQVVEVTGDGSGSVKVDCSAT